jgi:cell division protein FtsQ
VLDKPILTGWSGSEQLKIKLCQILQSVPASSLTDISEIKPDPSESYPDKIKIYTRSQFEVVTTVGYLQDKLKYLDSYIANLKENKIKTGQLKLLEADTHAPFEQDAQGTKDGAAKGSAGKDAGKDAGADKKSSGTQSSVSPQDAKKEPAKAAGNSSPVKENNTSGKESPRN